MPTTSVSMEAEGSNEQNDIPERDNLQQEDELDKENKQGDGNANVTENVNEEEDEDEDVDFNPFLKDTNSVEASSSLSSEVEDLDTDVAESRRKSSAPLDENPVEKCMGIASTSGVIEHGEEAVMRSIISSGEIGGNKSGLMTGNKELSLMTHSENGLLCEKDSDLNSQIAIGSATDSRTALLDVDAEGAICMRTRARYSLASFTLDELETFLQETDGEDDLQNVDDEEEYRKFLAAVLRGDDSVNLQENADPDDEDEENDADFELELEEALESEPEEIEEQRITRRNRRHKASTGHSKNVSGQFARPLRPLLPFASTGPFPAFDGKQLTPEVCPSYVPPVNNGFACGFTPHQIGQLHCLIHEHVQLLIQVFSLSVLEPVKRQVAAEVKELISEVLHKRVQLLAWRTIPYPNFCFAPPYIHPSVLEDLHSKSVPCDISPGRNRELPSDNMSLSTGSQVPECTSWTPYISGPVLSVIDVAPLKLVENYMDDISSAVQAYERCQIEIGFDNLCKKEPLFPLHGSSCSAESDGQGEVDPDSSGIRSSSSNRTPKKTMAATLLERAKNQSIALVPKEISNLAQRFLPLFNHALYPHKPPPAPILSRVLFTDTEDELLALGLMEYNTDWKAIQQRFLPCKSRHQIFVRQKNRASSKAPENPIKAVRRIKNAPLTSEEIARIELGLKKFKLDWISIWRFFLPYRDPSLLPRQWRIACGTQKSYKSDANKKAKRRLYELRRKANKPPPSWNSSSEKEGGSTDNAVEDANSRDNHMDKEDEAYVHEAFLSDWRPENNVSASLSTCLYSDGSQAREQTDKSNSVDVQSLAIPKPPTASRSSYSQVVMRPYRARRPNSARMVKLAPGLPPVNLPPSVRIISQSAFKTSQTVAAAANISGKASRIGANATAENPGRHPGSSMNQETSHSLSSGPCGNNSVNISASSQRQNNSDVLIDKRASDRGNSDLQMHPLLFQAPQNGHLPYYPLNNSSSTSTSFAFLSGKQPQLSTSLFHNPPRDLRDAVNFLSKSSKTPGRNAAPCDTNFHPLLQRTHDEDSISQEIHPASARLCSSSETRKRNSLIQNPIPSTSKPSLTGGSTTASKKAATHSNELDLDTHPSFTSNNQEAVCGSGRSLSSLVPGAVESETRETRDSAADRIDVNLDSGSCGQVASRNKGSRKDSDNMCYESLPDIVMEQEELSDSEEEFGENVEFEHEEMADSEGDSTSDSNQFVNLPNEEQQLDEMDLLPNTCSMSDGQPVRLELPEKVVNIDPNAIESLNLNSCPPLAPRSNVKKPGPVYEFGPFGAAGTLGSNQLTACSKRSSRPTKPRTSHVKKRADDSSEQLNPTAKDTTSRNPRKRICRPNSYASNAGSGKGILSPNADSNVQILKNTSIDELN